MNDVDFTIDFENFHEGLAPLAHIDSKTFIGNRGQGSEMRADLISKPGFITQSPGLTNLINGTQAGVVNEVIRFILDAPTEPDTTFAVAGTKLFKLTSEQVISGGTPSWPQTIANMTEGESIIRLGNDLLIFYNKSSEGDIAAMSLASESIDDDWGSETDQALIKAPHPSDKKEDTVVFGNGQYVGVLIQSFNSLDTRKLDFGEGAEVVDIVFNANVWWIAVNYSNRRSQVYIYDGSALSNLLSDEVGVGEQKIGFLYIHNGIVYIAYVDETFDSDIFSIGWISGRQIKPLRYFRGTLPNYRQKTLYKNTILFLSDGDIGSCGATVEQLPIQISRLASGGYQNLGAIASPFGIPIVSSTDGESAYRIAKFSGFSTDSYYKTLCVDTTQNRKLGRVHTVIVRTKILEPNAKCKIKLLGNQETKESNQLIISGDSESKTYHMFRSIDLPPVEDIKVFIDYSEGNVTQDCPIRKITLLGNFVEI